MKAFWEKRAKGKKNASYGTCGDQDSKKDFETLIATIILLCMGLEFIMEG